MQTKIYCLMCIIMYNEKRGKNQSIWNNKEILKVLLVGQDEIKEISIAIMHLIVFLDD